MTQDYSNENDGVVNIYFDTHTITLFAKDANVADYTYTIKAQFAICHEQMTEFPLAFTACDPFDYTNPTSFVFNYYEGDGQKTVVSYLPQLMNYCFEQTSYNYI